MEDIDIILKAIHGDKTSLEFLLKKIQSSVYTTLFYLKKDRIDIKDIAQNILFKVSKKISQLKNPKFFKTWLNQIIINSYYDYIRKNKRLIENQKYDKFDEESLLKIPDNSSNPQNSLLFNELDLVIKTSINNLPLHYKIPITLREIQGLTYDEISDITKTSVGTVKSRIARARAIIKDKINSYRNE